MLPYGHMSYGKVAPKIWMQLKSAEQVYQIPSLPATLQRILLGFWVSTVRQIQWHDEDMYGICCLVKCHDNNHTKDYET